MRLGDTRFFNLFALLASTSNPDRTKDAWQVDQVRWVRERSSFKGPLYSFQVEIHTLCHAGRRGWMLLVAHETWWSPERKDPFRNGQWAHLSKGARRDAEAWFAKQEAALER
jgi:hypothetical protein